MNVITKNLRKEILKVSNKSKSGHIGSSFSILECLYSLYFEIIEEDDIFILSKGHGSLGLYSILMEKNFISKEEFETFCSYNSILGGHPDRNKNYHIFASTGSLGHGLPIAVGVALSKKIKNKKGRVFCLLGDGECNEGTTWESLLLASHLNLSNLVCIVDNNNSQVRSVPTSHLELKFSSFGWDTTTIDGHNINSITLALKDKHIKPKCIVAQTIKGKGISAIESDKFSWHHKPPTNEELIEFLKELDNK